MVNTVADKNSVLIVKDSGSTRWLMLNRPTKKNALNTVLADSLICELTRAESDDAVRVVVLTGTGDAFCSGADLKEFSDYRQREDSRPDFLDRMDILNRALRYISKPTIAAINGLACAGGLELALCCDVIIAVESAMVGDAHVNVAAFPGGGGASILVRRIGMARAKYLLYTGELLPAKTLTEWGAFTLSVGDPEALAIITAELASKLQAKSPLVLKELKRIVDDTYNVGGDLGLQDEMNTLRALCRSEDMEEGFSAFLERRQPVFKGV